MSRAARLAWWGAALLSLGACAPGGHEGAMNAAQPENEGAALHFTGSYPTYGLYDLVRPSGSDPLPARFDEGQAAFDRGRDAYQRKGYREAAAAFMRAAERLRLPRGQPYWETFAADRMWAYRNAASAWAMADALDEAKRALGAAATEDAECAAPIGDLLEHLPTPVPAE